jgi:hypothetical protein
MHGSILAILLSVQNGPAQIRPPQPDSAHSLQCFLAVSELAASDDPAVKMMGTMGALFFAGQVFGADPGIDLQAAVRDEARILTPQAMAALRTQCGAEMQKRGVEIQEAGQALQDEPITIDPR